jgi:hypothetical protein
VIVRILTDGQYRIDDSLHGRLHELDEQVLAAAEAGDEKAFHARYCELVDLIESQGVEVADDDLVGSDLMLPPRDVSLDEALAGYADHGLIPE